MKLLSLVAFVILTLACGSQSAETKTIPPIGDWPCSKVLESGQYVYPKLVNEAKKYAAPFSIDIEGISSRGGLRSDDRYLVTMPFDVVNVDHSIDGLLDPVSCEMTPTEIRKYGRYNRVIDRIDLSE